MHNQAFPRRFSSRQVMAAALLTLVGQHASANVTANVSVQGLNWQTEKINPLLPGTASATLLESADGLWWSGKGPQRLAVTAPGQDNLVFEDKGIDKSGLPNGSFTYRDTFENTAKGWNLSATSTSTPGLYTSPPGPNWTSLTGGAESSILHYQNVDTPFTAGLLLSANTRISITGSFAGSMKLDATDTSNNQIYLSSNIHAEVSAYLNKQGDYYFESINGTERAKLDVGTTLNEWDLTQPGATRTRQVAFGDYGQDKDFMLQLSNTTDAPVWVVLDASLYTYSWQSVAAPLPPGYKPPAVPEPQTWALMALGLCGVTIAARRTRRRA